MNARFPFEDVDLICLDCGDTFLWNGKAQQRCFEERRQPPRRCSVCHDERRHHRELMGESVSDLAPRV
jgi:Probable zinc-ribbon domain